MEALTMLDQSTANPSAAPAVTARSRSLDAAAEWSRPLSGITLGLLLFESITGLAIYLLPFSEFNQFGVLLHTVLGVAMVAPVGWYVAQHWWRRFRGNFNHYQLLGYVSAVALIVLFVTGFVLTWQAMFGVRIGYAWDLVHNIVGFVFVAGLGAHLLTLLLRRSNNAEVKARRFPDAEHSYHMKSGEAQRLEELLRRNGAQ